MENIKFQVSQYQDELQLLIDGKKAGYMSIEVDGRLLIVFYTKLDEEREGKGYAKLLLDELVRYAEEKDLLVSSEKIHLKVVPECLQKPWQDRV